MGQGVGRQLSVGSGPLVTAAPPAPRVEHARPFSDEFWRFGLDKGTSSVFGQATRAAGAAAARVVEVVSAVRATPRSPFLMHARALSRQSTHRCAGQKGVQGSQGWTAQAER